MPALSPTMEKGNLAKWLKREGEPVKPGDVIAEIETDKATMEVEAIDEGTLGKILVPEGTNDVAVNTPIAMILSEGEDAAPAPPPPPPPPAPPPPPPPPPPRRRQAEGGRRAEQARADHACSGAAEIGGGGAAPAGNLAGARGAGRHRDDDHDGA